MAYYNPNYNGVQQPNFGSFNYPQQNTAGSWPWPQFQSQQQNQFSIVSIQGRSIAEDYPVAPGARVMMIDPNEMVAYIKERNPQGALLPFLTYDLVLREEAPKQEAAAPNPVIDYDRIREIIQEEVDNKLAAKPKIHKEAK